MTTTAGDLQLSIPKLRQVAFFPALLKRRRRVDQALYAVVMEAYLHGVSIRKVDDLVKALGADTGISKSEVSRICADLDQEVGQFRDRDLSVLEFPYVFLDATYCKARVNHRVVSQAVVVAFGVAADGLREVLGFDVGDSENEVFWTGFLRGLKTRGLSGVKLVISDAHAGLKKAVGVAFQGAAWQRCRVHFMRNVLSIVPRASQEWWPRSSAPSSPSPIKPTSTPSSAKSSGCSPNRIRKSPECSMTRGLICSASPDSRSSTGRRSGRRTRYLLTGS